MRLTGKRPLCRRFIRTTRGPTRSVTSSGHLTSSHLHKVPASPVFGPSSGLWRDEWRLETRRQSESAPPAASYQVPALIEKVR